ncbi:hypothetical protein M7I_1646 [Glarea lozoyensis 74030]|uniref:Uncharacterized protein n=1 Tax=Glarea lozoyensis (strain ATCC 74030 / MF5533) TaxID=1104152 RepID=H0EGM9_GLAL7|nr:hypothetical protein M7I_1646 [Glarea lozoyensis 74030]
MGPYDNPQRRKIKDENLRAVVKKISERLDERVREVEARITEYFPKTGRKVSRSYPSYFLDKSESMAYEIGKGEHSAVFGDILKNSLILQPELEAGDYEADNYFLNVKLTAEDIPWDTKEFASGVQRLDCAWLISMMSKVIMALMAQVIQYKFREHIALK